MCSFIIFLDFFQFPFKKGALNLQFHLLHVRMFVYSYVYHGYNQTIHRCQCDRGKLYLIVLIKQFFRMNSNTFFFYVYWSFETILPGPVDGLHSSPAVST